MESPKSKYVVSSFILFIITFMAVVTGFFQLPPAGADSSYFMDRVFYYAVNLIFWISGAFLLNTLIRKFLWGKVFDISAGSKSIGMIEDFTASFIYLAAGMIILVSTFQQSLSASWILVFFLLLILFTFMRSKVLKIFSGGFISSTRPFKIGDWIRLINNNGGSQFVGEVVEFDRMAIQLKTECDTLMFFPNNLLDDYIIENYKGIKDEVRFTIYVELNSCIAVERAKRILSAAALQALYEINSESHAMPEVNVNKIVKNNLEYKINFWVAPWQKVSPEKAKDLVYTKVIEHLKFAGVAIDGSEAGKEEACKHDILKNVPLFDPLDEAELEKVSISAGRGCYQKGAAIIRQGEKGDSMYVLAEGILDVKIRANGSDEETVQVGIITPGEFFGEMSLFTGEDRSATVLAETDSVVLEIKKDIVKYILSRKPQLADEFGRIIAERRSENVHKLDELHNRKDSLIEKIIGSIKSYFEI